MEKGMTLPEKMKVCSNLTPVQMERNTRAKLYTG